MLDSPISFEKMEFGLLRKLSGCLDISFSELMDITPLVTPTRDTKNIIRGYTVSFGMHASPVILKKIRRLSPGNKVHLHYYSVNDLVPVKQIKNKHS